MMQYISVHLLITLICWDISHVFCAVSDQNATFTLYKQVDSAIVQIKFTSCPTLELSRSLISCSVQCASHPDCIAFDLTPSQCLLCVFDITAFYDIQGKLFREKVPISSGKPFIYICAMHYQFLFILNPLKNFFNNLHSYI